MTTSDWSDEWDDDDDLVEPDQDDESTELVPCPECGEQIYEESERCPACGSYIIMRTDSWAGRPMWWVVLGLLGVVATILAISL